MIFYTHLEAMCKVLLCTVDHKIQNCLIEIVVFYFRSASQLKPFQNKEGLETTLTLFSPANAHLDTAQKLGFGSNQTVGADMKI